MTHIPHTQVFLGIWTQTFVPRTHIILAKVMKGDRKKRVFSFKKGNKLNSVRNAVPKLDPSDAETVDYIRPSPDEHKLMQNPPIDPDCLPRTTASDQQTSRKVFLRSHCKTASSSTTDTTDHMDTDNSNAYKLIHTRQLWIMINTVTREHLAEHPRCKGNLRFDEMHEEQWGLVWREKAVCDRCQYRSSAYKLYEDIKTGKRGRRSATANVGFNIAMTQTPVAATSVIKMLLGGNIPAPSKTGMQKCASKVCKIIKNANLADMKMRREQLKKLNRWHNLPENAIAVQSDGTYNNSLYSGVGRTPFQPATQCSYVVCENMTNQKQVIAIETVNKLCSKHGFHTAADEACDTKCNECSATASMETNIGDEQKWAQMCFEDLKNDGLEINVLTTDPDTKAYRAAEELYERKLTSIKPEHQIDTRHLSQNHRKQIKNNVHVLNMMPGETRTYRLYLRNRFSIDISRRCQSEFECIHRKVDGNFKEMVSQTHLCISAIKRCYSGDHSYCKLHSNVCKGEQNDNWIVKSCYLPSNFRINASKIENGHALLECIEYRLSDDMLHATRFNSNSQKVEAFNRSLKRSLPKNVTFTRNYSGRAHSAAHSVNNGPGNSIRKLCTIAGCPIPPRGKVQHKLEALQVSSEKQKEREKSLGTKLKRKLRRNKMFKLYEKHQEQKTYIKSQLLKKLRANQRVARKAAARKPIPSTSITVPLDHKYQRNPRTNQLVRGKRHAGLCPP